MTDPQRHDRQPESVDGSLFVLENATAGQPGAEVSRATLAASNAQGAAAWSAQQYAEAAELFQRVVDDCCAALGTHDPDTLVAEGNLAVTHASLGRPDRGLDLLSRNVASRERVLGPSHPWTLTARYAIGVIHFNAERFPEALGVFSGVVAQR